MFFGLGIIEIVLLILVIGVAVFLIWFFIGGGTKPEP
jgi:hypothetical protein